MTDFGSGDIAGIGGKGGPEEKYPRKTPFNGPKKDGADRNTVTGKPGEGAAWPGPAAPLPIAPVPSAPPTPVIPEATAAATPITPTAPIPPGLGGGGRIASLFTPAVRRYGRPLASTPTAIKAKGYGFA